MALAGVWFQQLVAPQILGQMSMPYIPPKRTGVDLSHIRLNPDGSRYADISALKKRPEVKAQLDAIRARIRAAKEQEASQL